MEWRVLPCAHLDTGAVEARRLSLAVVNCLVEYRLGRNEATSKGDIINKLNVSDALASLRIPPPLASGSRTSFSDHFASAFAA